MNIDELVQSYKDEMIISLSELVRIKSVYDEPKPGRPFGNGVYEALQYMLNAGRRLGFEAKDADGYAGHLQYGDGDHPFGILVHLDVVPEGDGWTKPPFEATLEDGAIYGRGASDDKGPAVAALFAMRAIKEAGVKPVRPVRLVLGCNEENDWKCVEYYARHEHMPEEGFAPDAMYPVVNREKGLLSLALSAEFASLASDEIMLESITGGSRVNMVPGSCRCIIKASADKQGFIRESLSKFPYKDEFSMSLSIDQQGGRCIIESHGRMAHGSHPEEGKNAIAAMLLFLKQAGIVNPFIAFIGDAIGMDYSGKGLGIKMSDELSGPLTLNLGLINGSQNSGRADIDIRYPITVELNDILSAIKAKAEPVGIRVKILNHKEPHYVPEDSPLVQKLLKAYSDVTGQRGYTLSMGGATYARAMAKGVAFGAVFPGGPDMAHQADEHIMVDDLVKNALVYAHAICEMCASK